MVAGGAQVVVFSSGRGTPTGNPISPVIKITGNKLTFAKMEDNILEEIKGETPKPLGITKKKRPVMRRLIPIALTAAAAIAAFFVLDIHTPDSRQQDNMQDVEQAFTKLSTSDQAYLLSLYQDDVFEE
jgi:hypothetical protein